MYNGDKANMNIYGADDRSQIFIKQKLQYIRKEIDTGR